MPRKASQKSTGGHLRERRAEERYTLILRVGVLEYAGKRALCLVKNISPAGVQIKLYSKVSLHAEICIRVADETPIAGRIVWVEDDNAGIRFHETLDTRGLLRMQQKLTPTRRRSMPRVNVELSATLRTGGRTHRATVSDISSFGARIRTRSSLARGNRAVLTIAELPSVDAYVRWTEGTESGLAFAAPIPMQVIASWIDRL